MKKSLYNSLIYLSTKHYLLYNALSDKFMVLEPKLKQVLEDNDINSLSTTNPNFYKLLIKDGFITEDDINECEVLQKQLRMKIFDNKSFRLIINPTLNCNFKCWYCYETHSASKISEDVLSRIQNFINNKIKQKDLSRFHLSFFGGEPLLYFKDIVSPLIDYTYRKCNENKVEMSLSFTSNGYLVNEYFLNFLEQYKTCNNISMQITLDGCKEDHDKVRYTSKNGSFDVIIKNIKELLKRGIHIVLRINYTAQNIGKINDIISYLKDPVFHDNKLLVINFQHVWQDVPNSKDISQIVDETISNFRKHKFRVLYHNSDLLRNPCYADRENEIIVNYNGNIYKCTAVDFDKEERYGYLNQEGEVVWENDKHIKRLNSIFSNQNCFNCRIAPICGGGCSKHAMNNFGRDFCLLNKDEKAKDKLILDRFENKYL